MKKTLSGSCHCKAVTFEVDIDLDAGTGKCNCTFCWKQRMWTAGQLEPADFRLLTGKDALSDYCKSGDWGEGHHRFCSKCGIATHGDGRLVQMGDKPYVSVQLSALDDLQVDDLVSAPVKYMDGLHDAWWEKPVEIRHL